MKNCIPETGVPAMTIAPSNLETVYTPKDELTWTMSRSESVLQDFLHFLPKTVTSTEEVASWKIHLKYACLTPSGRLFVLPGVCSLIHIKPNPSRDRVESQGLNFYVAPYLERLLFLKDRRAAKSDIVKFIYRVVRLFHLLSFLGRRKEGLNHESFIKGIIDFTTDHFVYHCSPSTGGIVE